MNLVDRLLLIIAYFFRYFHLPHICKYALYLLLQKRSIVVTSPIAISNLPIELNLNEFIEYWIFMDGLYEKPWVKTAQKLVKDQVFIDIGANIGTYPLSLFKVAKKIYAFEPAAENYRRLAANITQNHIKNITVLNQAVYSKNLKQTNLFINKDGQGWHSLEINFLSGIQKITTITLDTFVQKSKITQIGLIKIDVEGAELEVLKGAIQVLEKLHPPILIEFNTERAGRANHSTQDLYSFITKYHYQGFRMKEGQLARIHAADVKDLINENVLFTKS